MRLLILDNYDSFTYNLVHLVEKTTEMPFDVLQNDRVALEQIKQYDKILLSPGPGLPSAAGIMPELLKNYHQGKSIFGVCLGLQAIGETFGCRLKNLDKVYHGLATKITVTGNDSLFAACPPSFNAGRYHSWVIDETTLPGSGLTVTAVDDNGLVMAVRHQNHDICGVQFHPESILSEHGETIIRNWLSE